MHKKIITSICLLGVLNSSAFCLAATAATPGTAASTTTSTTTTVNTTTGTTDVKPIDTIQIINPWARPSLSPNNNSAAYLTIKNTSNSQYTLSGAGAMRVANNVELHQSYVDEKGVSKMTSIDKIIIPANSEIVLKPAGMHIMLLDLKRTLNVGDKFKLDLKFKDIGTKTVDVEVKMKDSN